MFGLVAFPGNHLALPERRFPKHVYDYNGARRSLHKAEISLAALAADFLAGVVADFPILQWVSGAASARGKPENRRGVAPPAP
jgi:hypothetical protein